MVINKIIVEGFDNSGKSTLIKALKKRFGFDVHWAGGKPASPAQAVVDTVEQVRMVNTIHDRFTPISRQCYEDPKDLVPFELSVLEKNLDRVNKDCHCAIIYCTGRGGEEQKSDCDTDEHVSYVKNNEVAIRSRYESLMSVIDHIEYDWRVDTVDRIFISILGGIDK